MGDSNLLLRQPKQHCSDGGGAGVEACHGAARVPAARKADARGGDGGLAHRRQAVVGGVADALARLPAARC
jgi:hypothetical protein